MLGRLYKLKLTESHCCGEDEHTHRGAGQAQIPPTNVFNLLIIKIYCCKYSQKSMIIKKYIKCFFQISENIHESWGNEPPQRKFTCFISGGGVVVVCIKVWSKKFVWQNSSSHNSCIYHENCHKSSGKFIVQPMSSNDFMWSVCGRVNKNTLMYNPQHCQRTKQ